MNDITFPYKTKALCVKQRLGTFYVVVLPAELLLKVTYPHAVRATMQNNKGGYKLEGTQRKFQDKRLKEIASYINRVDSTFPNSIILAANHQDKNYDQENDDSAEESRGKSNKQIFWSIKEDDDIHELTIPSQEKLASIIDGQHRLLSFDRADIKARRETNLICSVFLDLPKAYQAQIFATINSTQKSVDRSLTYELFGYNISDEEELYWTPDKLAVYLTRKLATDENSPLRGKIMVAPINDASLENLSNEADWRVSTAVIVDGILRLITNNPRRDTDKMKARISTPRDILRNGPRDNSPLRNYFIEENDKLIYQMVFNYLCAVKDVFWTSKRSESFIFRSVGIQAIFDILRKIAQKSIDDKNIRVDYFSGILEDARTIDFSEEKYRNPSGSGRSIIRRDIEEKLSIKAGEF